MSLTWVYYYLLALILFFKNIESQHNFYYMPIKIDHTNSLKKNCEN